MKNKPTILLVGPVHPAIGGISIYLSNLLNSKLSENYNFISFSTNHVCSKLSNSINLNPIFTQYANFIESIFITFYHIMIFPAILIKNKPCLIHIHTASYLSFLENSIYVIFSKLLMKKVILHIHGGAFNKFYLNGCFLTKTYIKFTLASSDQIISISSYWRDFFIKYISVSENSVSVVYNGYDQSLFFPMDTTECRKKLNLPLDKKIIITVGNLLDEKGHKYLIEAMTKILAHRKDVICVIIGDGKLKSELEHKVKDLKLNTDVMILGKKPHKEIPLWLNASDIFVLPSLVEGNPTVMSESLGTGLPFIGTKVGAVPEIIVSDDYGILVEPEDQNDIVEKILVALEKKWNRRVISEYAENFRWVCTSNSILKIYNATLN